MVAHTIAFREEKYCVTVHNPSWRFIKVTTTGDVCNFTTFSAHDSHIAIWVMHIINYLKCKPFSVGRPSVIKTTIATSISRAVGHLTHFFALYIHYHQLVAVLNECKFFTIGRILRISAFNIVVKQFFFNDSGSIREIGIFLTLDSCCIDIPFAIAFAHVCYSAIVGSPCRLAFGFGSVSDLFGSRVVG